MTSHSGCCQERFGGCLFPRPQAPEANREDDKQLARRTDARVSSPATPRPTSPSQPLLTSLRPSKGGPERAWAVRLW